MRCVRTKGRWIGAVAAALGAVGAAVAVDVAGTERWSAIYDAGYADYGLGVAIDSEGNVASVGQSGAATGTNGFLERRLVDGTFDWRVVLDNTATVGVDSKSGDTLLAVVIDPSDDVIAGGVWSGNYYDPADGFWSGALVRKYTPGGSLLWEWKGNAGYGAWSTVRALATDPDGNIYAAGQIFGNWGIEETQWGIWKFDASGALQSGFPVTYDHSHDFQIADIAYAIAAGADGSFVVAGVRGVEQFHGDPARHVDWHVRRYAADRTLVWEDTFSGPTLQNDFPRAVVLDAAGDAYVAGYTNVGTDGSANLDWNALVIKYAKDTGERLWTRQSADEQGVHGNWYGVAAGPDGTLICSGSRAVIGTPPTGPWSEMLDASDGSLIVSEATAVTADVAIQAISRRGDLLAFAGYAAGATTIDAMSSLYELAPLPNRAPVVDADPWADVDIAAVGEPVGFHVRAHDPDGDPLTVHWEFSNSPGADGLDVVHTFQPSGGSYGVVATISDGTHQVERTMSFRVGDPFRSPSIRADLNFRTPGRDLLTLTCRLALPYGFTPGGRKLTVSVGGLDRSFALDDKGRASTPEGTVRLTWVRSAKRWALVVRLARGDYAAAWADDGLMNATVRRRRVTLKTTVEISDDIVCAHRVREFYQAKRNAWGRVR